MSLYQKGPKGLISRLPLAPTTTYCSVDGAGTSFEEGLPNLTSSPPALGIGTKRWVHWLMMPREPLMLAWALQPHQMSDPDRERCAREHAARVRDR